PLAFDVAYQFVPWRHFAWESLRQGRLPLWNPYSLAGTPFIASMQSAVFYPINLLFTPLPFARTFAWSALLRLWIAGFSAYLPALAVALGTALAAAQLLPFLEWLPLSAEWARRPAARLALFDPRCWRELLALPLVLFPNLYGNPTWPGPYRSYLPWGNYSENV